MRFPRHPFATVWFWGLIGLLLACPRGLVADEPVSEFLNGLYRRGDVDIAMMYLETLDADTQLPATTRESLPFHRAVTLVLKASQTPRRDEQKRLFQKADELLHQFLQQQSGSLLAGQAHGLLSEVQLQLAQRKILDEEQNPDGPQQTASMADLRQQIAELRSLFDQQRQRAQQTQDQYPAYIAGDEPELRRARDRVLEKLIRSRLDLAQCDYWEAHTYPVEHASRQQLLTAAAAAYESLHQRYRSQIGGLYARLWQGKCYEELRSEQGVRLALGIYGELLGHDGTSVNLLSLKDRARLYRLICLNSSFRKDYQLVEIEAVSWLEAPESRIDSEAGLGIQWELCRALESLSQDEKCPMETRVDYLLRARERIVRLLLVTGGQTREFEDFRRRVEAALSAAGVPGAVHAD